MPRLQQLGNAIFVVFLMGFVFLLAHRPNWDIDIFWHIAAGKWIVENGRLPSTDIFAYTDPSRAWSSFQWLYEVITYELDSHIGFWAVRGLHTALFLGTFVAWFLFLRRYLPQKSLVIAFVMLLVALSLDRLRVRPEAFNFFFLAILLPFIFGGASRERGLPKWWEFVVVGLVAAIWANVHAGGAVFLPVAFVAVFAGRLLGWFVGGRTPELWHRMTYSFWLGLTSGLVMLPMPSFLRGVWTAHAMMEVSAPLIPEWAPPTAYLLSELTGPITPSHFICGTVPYVVLLLAGFGLIHLTLQLVRRQKPTGDVGLMVLAFVMTFIATRSARFGYLDLVALTALFGYYRNEITPFLSKRSFIVVSLLVALFLGWAAYNQSVTIERRGLAAAIKDMKHDNQPGIYPDEAVKAMVRMGLTGRVFHLSAWGGHLLYHLFPDCKVFSDGRGNFTMRERDLMVAAHRPWERAQRLDELYAEYPFDIVVFPPPMFPLKDWDYSKWILVYTGPDAEVFLRNHPENKENIQRLAGYWQMMGLQFADTLEMQRAVRHMMAAKMIPDDLDEQARLLIECESPEQQAKGWAQLGTTRFEAGLWETASRPLSKALALNVRNDTTALYLVWSLTLQNKQIEARQAIWDFFIKKEVQAKTNQGPLNASGHGVFEMLANRLGITQ